MVIAYIRAHAVGAPPQLRGDGLQIGSIPNH